MAQVTFVADAETANNTDTSTQTVVTKPTGTTNGDLLITTVFTNDGDTAITTLSGWTLLDTETGDPVGEGKLAVYWKIASSEGSDYTWVHDALSTNEVIIFHTSAWRNTHQTAPLAVYSKTEDDSSDTTSTGTGVTTDATPHGVLLQMHGAPANATFSTYAVANNNPSWTEIVDTTATNSAGSSALAGAYANYDLAQATGNATATISTSTTSLVFVMFIRPAGFAFDTTLTALTLATFAATLTVALPTTTLATLVTTPYASTLATADLTVSTTSKNAASTTATSKTSASATAVSKNSASFTAETKHSV